jgi:hypothetical protein
MERDIHNSTASRGKRLASKSNAHDEETVYVSCDFSTNAILNGNKN